MVDAIHAEAIETITISGEVPREAQLLTPAENMLRDIQALTIDAPAMYDIAAGELRGIKAAFSKLESERLDLTRPLDEVKRKIMDRFRRPLEILTSAESALKSKMLVYREDCERREAEERRKAEEAARAERDRLAREAAERERQSREEAEAARRQADADAEEKRRTAAEEATKLAAEGRAKEAADLKAKAEAEATARQAEGARQAQEVTAQGAADAEELRRTAAVVIAPAARTSVPAAKGTSVRRKWKGRIIDKHALVRHVAAFPQFGNLVDVNESALNQLANSLQGALELPGVECYEDKVLASGSR
jgi:hypothetical protein